MKMITTSVIVILSIALCASLYYIFLYGKFTSSETSKPITPTMNPKQPPRKPPAQEQKPVTLDDIAVFVIRVDRHISVMMDFNDYLNESIHLDVSVKGNDIFIADSKTGAVRTIPIAIDETELEFTYSQTYNRFRNGRDGLTIELIVKEEND